MFFVDGRMFPAWPTSYTASAYAEINRGEVGWEAGLAYRFGHDWKYGVRYRTSRYKTRSEFVLAARADLVAFGSDMMGHAWIDLGGKYGVVRSCGACFSPATGMDPVHERSREMAGKFAGHSLSGDW